MIKRFYLLLLAIVASVGMSFAQDPGIVSSGTKGGMSYTFYDNGLLEISGSGALPGHAFTNWDGGFGTSVKNIRFAEDCEVYGLDYLWFACYTENSQLETVEINSVAPIMFSAASGEGIFYRQDGAVTITITAPGIVDVEGEIIDNYGSPVNMIFNMPATTVFEKKWFSGLENNFAVTIPTGATGHIPAGYVFKDSYDQKEYDDLVADGYEDMFWDTHSDLVEGVDYTLGVESTFVITAENASQIFGQATVSFQAPTEASNSEWVLWRKSDLKEFPDMSSGDQKVCKDVTVKVNNGVYNTDSGWGLHFESLGEDGVQFVAPEGKVFKRIVISNEYGTFSDSNWSYNSNYKRWSGSADTVGFVGNICGISLIEFEVEASAPANSCGGGLTWELNNGELVISYDGEGTGVMNDYDIPNDNPAPWYANRENITSVSLPEGIKTIGKDAFRDCVNLTTVTIPNSVTTIGESAFVSVAHLETVTIGTGITSIVNGAFYGNDELTTVTCSATTPPSIGEMVFGSCPNLTQIIVPAASVDAYKTAWSDYASLISAAGGGSTTDPIVIATNTEQSSYTQGSITVSVNYVGDSDGFRLNNDNSASISNSGSSTISKIELVPGWFLNKHSYVRANGAEPNSSSEELITFLNVNSNEVTLSCSVSICIKEVRVYFGEAGGGSTPANSCGGGLTWELNNGELVISYDGEGTGVMNDYDIPHDNYAPWYANRENITSVSLPEGIKTIGKDAFRNCVNLTTVTIPNSVTTIGESAFVSVAHLETVTIGTGITSIVNGAFYGNAELTTVTCSATTPPSIGEMVFGSCSNLKNIYVPTESVDAYKTAWSDYASIISAAGGGSTDVIPCTAADLGKVLCTDGSIYTTVSDATAANKTAVAMIAYVDTENGKALALALANESGTMDWETAKTTAAAHTPAVSGGTWTLPSKDDWDHMINAAGGYNALRDGFSGVGGTNIQKGQYWTSTEYSSGVAMVLNFGTNDGGYVVSMYEDPCNVRACLAFDIPAAPAYETVMNLIEAIGTVELTAECKAKIDAARAAFDALSDEDKAQVTNITTLTQAETDYAALNQAEADKVVAKINNIPTQVELKLATRDSIESARAAYDALTADQKLLVSNYDVLTAAEATMATLNPGGDAPDGALNGKFSIDESSVVYFSKGNLQATTTDLGANWTWGFAANQWNTIGNAAANNAISGNGTVSANGTVDLFGWSTSTTKYGIHNGTNSNISDYAGDFVDWGTTMGDGWFTLSKEQWHCLLNTRTGDKAATVNSVADCRYTKATINTDGTAVKGMILFPDGGTFAASEFTEVGSPNTEDANYTTTCTTAQWNALQAKGCVFLPAAGRRYGADVSTEDPNGYYWSSSPKPSTDDAYYMFFYSYGMYAPNDFRCLGLSVRLVIEAPASPLNEAQAAKDLIEAIPAEITLEDNCVKAVQAARDAYNALTEATKGALDAATVNKLNQAITDYTALIQAGADAVTAKIALLPNPVQESDLKLSVYDKVLDARAAYDALTADQKLLVTNLAVLEAAEAAFAAIPGGAPTVVVIYKSEFTSTGVTKEGVNLALSNGSMTADDMLAMDGSFEFSTSLGKFTNITIETDANIMQIYEGAYTSAGWPTGQNLGTSAVWTGESETVLISCMVAGNAITITCTVAPASVIADAIAARDLINAIPDTITLADSCVNAIQAARDAYDALSEAAQGTLDAETVQKLTDAEAALTALNQAEADKVIAKIAAIPQPVELKLATRDSIESARAAYDALNAAQQALVSNYQTLLDAEAALAGLNPGGGMPADALNGKFTINADGDQISFAKGNLQATTTDLGANWTWGFAANQWDYLGIAVANSKINGNGTVSENGTVDLFGWSTAATYYGINNSYKAVDYIGDFVDWGPNMGAGWRTLTKDEWNYLIENNTKGRATVNDKSGYIFLPNDWSGPAFTPDPDNFTTNVYSGDDWTTMENAGAVFLPSGPARNGVYALIANDAKYSSSTSLNNDSSYVFTIYYNQSQSACTGSNRAYGCMVRLVTEGGGATPLDSAQAVKDLIDAIPVPVSLADSCVNAIEAAREAYNALSEATKGALDAETVKKLTDAEQALKDLNQAEANKVIAKINAIPQPVELKLATRDSIQNARTAYDALNAAQQALVPAETLKKLTDAEEALAGLNPGGSVPVDIVWDGNTGIANVDPNTTSPAYEGMTVTVGNGSSFSTYQSRLYFTFYSQPNGGYIFANVDGSNITKVVIESATALTSTMTEVERMGSGWAISNENKTATWTGDADSVSIWKGQSFTNYWVVDTITFTVNGVGATPLDSAQAVKDLIDAIPVPVTLDSKDEIDAARDAYDALADLTKGALDDATVTKLTDAEDAYAALIKEATDVIALINAIPQPVVYNEACGDSIIAARNAYDALSDELKPLVTNYPVLTDAEAAYEKAKAAKEAAEPVIVKINNIPLPVELKLATRDSIESARAAFDALTDDQMKDSVSNYQTLLDAEAALADLVPTPTPVPVTPTVWDMNELKVGDIIYEGDQLTNMSSPRYINDETIRDNKCPYTLMKSAGETSYVLKDKDGSYLFTDGSLAITPASVGLLVTNVVSGDINVVVYSLANVLDSAQAVKDLIDAIPDTIVYPTSGPAIEAALVAYNQLSDAAKGALDDADVQKLTDAATQYAALDAIAAIEAIPDEIVYDPAVKAAIETAREKYDALVDDSKALVPEDKVHKLTNAEQAWAILVAKIEHNVSYIGKDGELKHETVALLHIPDPAPEFNGYEFVRWDVKAGDFLEEGLRIKAVYTPIITTNPVAYDTLVYNGTAQTLITAGVAKEGHIEYRINDGEWSTELPKATFAAAYVVYYKLVREGHPDYIADSIVSIIAKAPVVYTAPVAYDTLVYNAEPQTLIIAGQTQDGTFEYTTNPAVLDSWKTELPMGLTADTLDIYYRVLGDANHLDSIALVPVQTIIAKAPLKATADDKTVTYADAKPEYTVTYSGWQGEDTLDVLVGDIRFVCEYTDTTSVGEYAIFPYGVTAHDYAIDFVPGKLTVNKAALTITAEDKTRTYGDSIPEYTVTYSGFKNKDTADVVSGLQFFCEYKQTSNVGEYAIHPDSATAKNYAISFVDGKLTVSQAALKISADAKTVIYGDAVPTYTASYEGWKNTDDESVVSGLKFTCEYAPTSNVGKYVINPNSATATNYAITFVNDTLTVNQAPLMITADNKSVEYGEKAPAFTASYSGWKNNDSTNVVSGLTLNSAYLVTSNVGTYDIVADSAKAMNYAISYTKGTLTVTQAPLMITADNKSVEYGEKAPAFTASYSGWKNNDTTDVVSGLTLSSSYLVTSNVGTYDIVPSGATAMNYAISFTKGTLTVNQAPLMITADDKSVEYGEQAPEFTASYSGWKNNDTTDVVSGLNMTSSYLVTSNVGDYDIVPSGATAMNYAISFTKGTLTVNQAPLMITADDKSVEYGEQAPEFTASYSGWKNNDTTDVVSGLTLSSAYLVTSNVGTYDIVADSAKAMNYAISYTKGTLTVTQAPLTITANDTAMIYGDAAPEFTASYSGWKNADGPSVVSGLAYTTDYQIGKYVGTYTITPNSATAMNYAISFVDGKLTVNKATVYVSGAETHTAKFADGHANAEVTKQGTLNGIKLSDPIAHVTTAAFSSADVAEHLTITLFYELTGDAALLNNYLLTPTSEIFTTEGVIIEPFVPNDDHQPEEGEQVEVKEGIDVYAYGYCDGSGYSLKYHLNSGNPDQYKIDFADSRFTNLDWTNLETAGKDGTIDIEIPVDVPTGDYSMTVYFRDSRFDWLESRALNVTFHVNLPETYVRPLFDNVIALVDTCNCLTDIQWYHRANSSDTWQPIPGANGYYYRTEGKLTGEYFVKAKMNGVETYTCGQSDMETLYGDTTKQKAQVKAYPNPVLDKTTVVIEGSTEWQHDLRIVNLMGNEMINTTFEGNETSVEMTGYPQGNYMISVDGIVVKVMKQ